MQQGLTIVSNKLTSFDCCGLRSTRRDETARTCYRMTDTLTIWIDCVDNIDVNALSGYQESNLGEMGDNLVHANARLTYITCRDISVTRSSESDV